MRKYRVDLLAAAVAADSWGINCKAEREGNFGGCRHRISCGDAKSLPQFGCLLEVACMFDNPPGCSCKNQAFTNLCQQPGHDREHNTLRPGLMHRQVCAPYLRTSPMQMPFEAQHDSAHQLSALLGPPSASCVRLQGHFAIVNSHSRAT
jgi:hypothetical protein